MKIIIISILILVGLGFGAELDAARFDWSLGEPTIADDDASTTRYDWSLGQPVVVYEYQAAEEPAVTGDSVPYIIIFD